MSNINQPSSANMLDMLAVLTRAILETAPPEIKDALRQYRESRNKSTSPAAAAPESNCDCQICNLRKSFEELVNEAVRIQFKLVLEGSVSMEIADMVGGIKADSEADDSKDRANRVMAALLIATAKESNADTEEKKILKATALVSFTKGINALNDLRASATPVTA